MFSDIYGNFMGKLEFLAKGEEVTTQINISAQEEAVPIAWQHQAI